MYKIIYTILLLVLCGFTKHSFTMEMSPYHQYLIEKYKISKETKEIIDKNLKNIHDQDTKPKTNRYVPLSFDWLPGYKFIRTTQHTYKNPVFQKKRFFATIEEILTKFDFIRHVIEVLNLDLLTTKHAYLYHIPSKPKKLSPENYYIFLEEFEIKRGFPATTLNKKYAQQLADFVLVAGYTDGHIDNILYTKDGKLAVIDMKEVITNRSLDIYYRKQAINKLYRWGTSSDFFKKFPSKAKATNLKHWSKEAYQYLSNMKNNPPTKENILKKYKINPNNFRYELPI